MRPTKDDIEAFCQQIEHERIEEAGGQEYPVIAHYRRVFLYRQRFGGDERRAWEATRIERRNEHREL